MNAPNLMGQKSITINVVRPLQALVCAILLSTIFTVSLASEDARKRTIPDKLDDQGNAIRPSAMSGYGPTPLPFGTNLFTGNFLKGRGEGLNDNYVIAPGDKVAVAVWGSLQINKTYTVDSQGNIFMPEIGPLKLEGVENKNLTNTVRMHIQTVYRENFDVYTNLVTTQPIGVFVTGMVENPGRYAGLATDSILYFLDIAGGIDHKLGSFRNIDVVRSRNIIESIDLYKFIFDGKINTTRLMDGDTIVVRQRGPVVQLVGNVGRDTLIELAEASAIGSEVLKIVRKLAHATRVSLLGTRNGVPINESLTINAFLDYELQDGDVVTLLDDGKSNTILVHVEGEFTSSAIIAVQRGARLLDVLNYIAVDEKLADLASIHIRRTSVARAQKDAINDALFRLERSSLLALSESKGQADIKVQEAQLMKAFIERAKLIDPLGRVVTSQDGVQQNIRLEAGDTIVIPRKTELVRIAGEVMTMHAMTFRPGWTAAQYIEMAGGFSGRAEHSRVIIHRPNAEVRVADPDYNDIGPGDEIIVPPRVDTKYTQYALDISTILYKLAVAAAVVLAL